MSSGPIVTMPEGLPGFESCRRFVLVSSETIQPFTCLQALDEPRPSFLSLDPRQIVAEYAIALNDADRARIDARRHDPLLWLAVVSVADENATANLRAPIVINPRTMLGMQLIPSESPYATRHPLPVD